MLYAIVNPAGVPVGARLSMADAQAFIAEQEPDVLLQGKWKIHPISSPEDAEKARLKIVWTLELKKFSASTGECEETVFLEGED